jgi:hypothetical protein
MSSKRGGAMKKKPKEVKTPETIPPDLADLIIAVIFHPQAPSQIWTRIIDGLEEIRKWNFLTAYQSPELVRELLRIEAKRQADDEEWARAKKGVPRKK